MYHGTPVEVREATVNLLLLLHRVGLWDQTPVGRLAPWPTYRIAKTGERNGSVGNMFATQV